MPARWPLAHAIVAASALSLVFFVLIVAVSAGLLAGVRRLQRGESLW